MTEPDRSETITIISLSDVQHQMSSGDLEEQEGDLEEKEEEPISKFGQWEEWPNEEGVSYFYNKETGDSQWEDPRLGAGAVAAKYAILDADAPKDGVQGAQQVLQEKKEDEEKLPEKRFLVRDTSVHKWELNDIENMKSDMLAQLHMLQNETRKSGARMPTLRKKYRPIRAPPKEPPASQRKKRSGKVSKSGMAIMKSVPEKPEKPTALPPLPFPSVPKSLPPTAPADFPPSLREHSPGSVSADEMSRSKSSEVHARGRARKRESQRSVNSDFLSTESYHNVFIAVSDFSPDDSSKLELKEGDKIVLQKKKSSGWWVGKNQTTGRSGFFPGSYVRKAEAVKQTYRRSKSQELSNRKPRMWSGKMMHDRSMAKRRSSRARKNGVTRKSSQISKRRNTRMGE